MTDARDWQPPTHADVRALLPQTQAERNDLAARIGVGARLMRYWWTGGKVPGYAHWRLLVEDAEQREAEAQKREKDDESEIYRRS